ncbi:MAG: Ig-like domain-containing protein, partial [Spirulinaceae cyanobacterium]
MDQLGSPQTLESSALLLDEENLLQLPEPLETAGTYQDPLLAAGTADLNLWGLTAENSPLYPEPTLDGNSHPVGFEPIAEQLSQLVEPEFDPDAIPTATSQAARAWLEDLLAQDELPQLVAPPTPVSLPSPSLGQMEAAFLDEALTVASNALSQWQANPDFTTQLETTFGAAWQPQAASELVSQWLEETSRPPIELLSRNEIGGRGAYAQSSNTIYLAREVLLNSTAEDVAALYLEELGHAFDAQLNPADTAGDEGAIFAALVQGQELNAAQLDHWRAEDDQTLQTINGETIALEHNGPPGITEGYFTVETSGQVTVDYLYDGSFAQGEVGLFSLSGMDLSQLGTLAFTQEALRRALTNTTEGHTVIADTQDGAKIDGINVSGEVYNGPKTVAMTPGDHFGIIITRNNTLQQAKDWNQTSPYISLVPSDDSNASAYQLRAIRSGQNVFAVEDTALPGGDKDYNDYVFSIEGATANVGLVDPHINPSKEWRNSPLEEALLLQPTSPDTEIPYGFIRLTQDNGSNPFDRLSNNGGLSGQILDPSGLVSVEVQVFGGGNGYTDITSQLDANGRFSLDEAQLETIKGAPLNEGGNAAEFKAIDTAGNTYLFVYGYQRDTILNLNWGLDPASDSTPVGDLQTDQSTVTLTGQTDPGSTITLDGQTATVDSSGNFSFTGVTLELGANPFEIVATDNAGNEVRIEQTITRTQPGSDPPQITLDLATDSGSDPSDGITNNPDISGQVTDSNGISLVQVSLNGSAYSDITSQLNPDGTFSLDTAFLTTLNGGTLPDGSYSLELEATDGLGNSDSQTLSFTLDTSTTLTWGLDPSSDSGTPGDQITDERSVTLTGQTDPGSTVTLTTTGQTTTADSSGNFSFSNVDLALGDNTLDITVTDAAGNTTNQSQTLTREFSTAPPAGMSEGYFTVEASGQVTVDYRYDGEAREGEIGIFSLTGMDLTQLGTLAFTQEALRRALTNTPEGHLVISDPQEGAKVDGLFNDGSYQGPKTLAMTPGDQFAVIITRTSTLQQAKDWNQTDPYISLVPSDDSNPGAYQLRSIQNNQNVFAVEDTALPGGDQDYDDYIFSIEGVIANVGLVDSHINPSNDWRNSPLEEALLPQPTSPDTENPYIFVKLSQDNGNSPYDRLSNDGSITGQVIDPSGITTVEVRFTDGSSTYTDITSQINPDGSFSLSEAELEAIRGGPLAEGINSTVEVRAVDTLGNATSNFYGYTRDTQLNLNWGLDPSSDSLPHGDLSTDQSTVTLTGQTDPGSTITLDGQTATVDSSGNFSFTGIALALGANPFEIIATDNAGNEVRLEQTVNRFDPAITPPAIALDLTSDSGSDASDGITHSPDISGQVTDSNGISLVQVSLNGSAYSDITSQLNPDGTFSLDTAFLTTLNGGSLPDGSYSLELEATDGLGNSGSQTLNFTLDTATTLSWGLDPASDSDPIGDLTTTAGSITLTGQTDPNSSVTLTTTGETTTADSSGNFSFTNIALNLGDNILDIAATDAAGNTLNQSQTITRELDTAPPAGISKGYFTVDATGQVTIDYLYDDGSYESELGIFSLAGMDLSQLGTPAFEQEALRRALSGTTEGHLVISDPQEGAKIDSIFNQGTYPGPRTVAMNPGDHFGVIAVRNRTLQAVYDGLNHDTYISLVPDDNSNPGAIQFGAAQAGRNIFVLEDIRLPSGDQDFNDIIFTFDGVIANIDTIDANIDPAQDWRNGPLGDVILYPEGADPDTKGPLIYVTLTEDTGANPYDRLTKNPNLNGQVVDPGGVSNLQGRFNDGDAFLDIAFQPDGRFSLDETQQAQLNNGVPLPDGSYTLQLKATDVAGNESFFYYVYEIDRAISLDWGLSPGSDTDPQGDLQTAQGIVTLTGQTDPGSSVTLIETGATATADANGNFSFSGIELIEGTNDFTIEVEDLAGNQTSLNQTITRVGLLPTIQLTENSDFTVEEQIDLQIPSEPSFLNFTINSLVFDTDNPGAINDAFEVSLLDAEGNAITHTLGQGRTALINFTEGEDPALAPGVTYDAATGEVSIDVSHLPAGTDVILDLRLVNNDSTVDGVADVDTATTVTLAGISDQNFVAVPTGHETATAVLNSRLDVEPITDFSLLENITSSVNTLYGQTSLNAGSEVLFAELMLENGGTYAADAPLLVVIDNLSDPAVVPLQSDGVLPDGRPYYDFSQYVDEDGSFDPGEVTAAGWIQFYNPTGEQFSYDVTVLGELNQAPVFTSTPDTEAVVGQNYSYTLAATDANGDVLSYRLLVAPSDLVLETDSETGEASLVWTAPDSSDAGTYAVVVEVSDGRGGIDIQTYTLDVVDGVPNRPPLFTSTPEVDAWLGQEYNYLAQAVDPDGDVLLYDLIFGPEGMTINTETGKITWQPEPFFNLGDTVFGKISLPGEVDEYTFYGRAGQEIYFDPLVAQDWQFEIVSPTGETLPAVTFEDPALFRLNESGRYQIKVSPGEISDEVGQYGFSLIDPSLAPVATFDEIVSGAAFGSQDSLYRFEGVAGQKLFIDDLVDTGVHWVLYGPDRNQIFNVDSISDSIAEQELPQSGEYLLVVEGATTPADAVDYAFEIITPTTQEYALGNLIGTNETPQLIASEITEKGEQDLYTFTGQAGQRLLLDLIEKEAGTNFIVKLRSPSGDESAISHFSYLGGDSNPITLTQDGTYTLEVDGSQASTGDYRFNIIDLEQGATPLNFDTPINGTLSVPLESGSEAGRNAHVYTFSGQAGERLYFDSSTYSSASWSLYDSGNQPVYFDSTGQDKEILLRKDDTYTLVIHGSNSSNTPIDYEFEVITPLTIDSGAVALASTSTVPQQPITGTLGEIGEWHTYTFTGQKGQNLFLNELADNPNIQVRIVAPSGRYWRPGSSNNAFNSASNPIRDFSTISDRSFELIEDGEYEVIVKGYEDRLGDYNFQLIDVDASTEFLVGQPLNGTIAPQAKQFYRFTGNVGERIYLDGLAGSNLEAIWYLPDGGQDWLSQYDAEIVIGSEQAYYLALTNKSNSPLAYDLEAIASSDTSAQIGLNTQQSGNIDVLGDQDTYTFTGQTGQQLFVELQDGTSSITYKVISPSGDQSDFGNSAIADGQTTKQGELLTLTEPGEYQIIFDGIFDGNNEALGSYQFQVKTVTPIHFNEPQSGTLSSGETEIYTFKAQTGQKLAFDAISGGDDFMVTVYNQAGQSIFSGPANQDAEPLEFGNPIALNSDNTYQVHLTGTGDYHFQIPFTTSFTPIIRQDVTTTLDFNTPTSINLPPDTPQLYKFQGEPGQSLWFDFLGSGSGSTVFKVHQPSGEVINLAAGSWTGRIGPSGLHHVILNESGEHYLEFGTPTYHSLNAELQVLTDTNLPTQTGNFTDDITLTAGSTKLYKLSGQVGDKVLFNRTEWSNSESFYLYNAQTNTRVGLSEKSPHVLDEPGDYYLAIESSQYVPQNDAQFQFLTDADATLVDLNNDPVLTGSFGAQNRDAHLYKFTAAQGERLYFDQLSSHASYDLYKPSGGFAGSSHDLKQGLPVDGEYLLVVYGNGSNSNYELQLVSTPEAIAHPPLTWTTTPLGERVTGDGTQPFVSGTLTERGEQHLYTFTGEANQQIWFDGLSTQSGIITDLLSPSGQTIWSSQGTNQDSSLSTGAFRLPEAGTYQLIVDGSSATTGDYQFRIMDVDQAPVMTEANGSIALSGDFGGDNETRIYQLDGTAGQSLYVDHHNGSYRYNLYAPDGQIFLDHIPGYWGGFNSNDLANNFSLPTDGRYTLVVHSASLGSYDFEIISPDFALPQALSFGVPTSGTISETGETDFFEFEGNAGQHLWFDNLLANGDLQATLYAPSGIKVGNVTRFLSNVINDPLNDPGSDAELRLVLPEDGTYRLEIDGYYDGVGDYQFQLLDASGQDAPLQTWDAMTDTIRLQNNDTTPETVDLYRFTGVEGETLFVDVNEQAGGLNYTLYDADGVRWQFPKSGDSGRLTLPYTGEYLLAVSNSSGYDLTLVTPDTTTTPYTLGETIVGSLNEPQETDEYSFYAQPGQKIWFDGLTGNANNYIRYTLIAPSGKALSQQRSTASDAPPPQNSGEAQYVYSLEEIGTYTVKVEAYSTSVDTVGDYSLRILDVDNAPRLNPDEPDSMQISGSLAAGAKSVEIYRFSGVAGQPFYLEDKLNDNSQTAGGQYRFQVIGPDGKAINLSTPTGADKELMTLPQDGDYTLVVESQGVAADYDIQVYLPHSATADLTLGTTVSGTVSELGEQDTFTFTGATGQKLFFDELVKDANLNIQLYAPGETTGTVLNDTKAITLTAPGAYRVVIEGIDGQPYPGAAYTFQLSDLATTPALPLGSPTTGQVAPQTTDLYHFTGTRGQILDLDLDDLTTDPGVEWVLYDSGNAEIARSSDANDFAATLPANGQYTLAVINSGATPLNYGVTATPAAGLPPLTNDLNRAVSGTITTTGPETYTITGNVGTQVFFTLPPNINGSITARLIAPDGSTEIFSANQNEHLTAVLPQQGDYTLEITGSLNSNYQFELVEFPASTRGANYLEVGHAVQDTLTNYETKVYTFNGANGVRYLFNGLEGNNVEATIYKPNGQVLASTKTGEDIDEILTLTEEGVYQLVLRGTQAGTQTSKFQILELSTATELTPNLATSVTIAPKEYVAQRITAEAGQTLFLDHLSGLGEIEVYGPNNQLVPLTVSSDTSNQDARSIELPQSGEYTIVVKNEGSSASTYEFIPYLHAAARPDLVTPGTGENSADALDGEGSSLGTYTVTVEADDGRGGRALQTYAIKLWPDPENNAPNILSQPVEKVALDQGMYRYQLTALDADGDALKYRLVDAPVGAVISTDTGELLWFPSDAVTAGNPETFTVEVTDGRGGFDTQTFDVTPHESLGTIQGTVFDDLNGNGLRDSLLIQGDDPAIVIAIDTSGSVAAPFPGPDGIETVLDAQIAATKGLIESYISQGLGNQIKIAIAGHNTGTTGTLPHDWIPGGDLDAFITPEADYDGNGTPDILEYLDALTPAFIPGHDGTDIQGAIDDISQYIDVLGTENPNVIFLSDGYDGGVTLPENRAALAASAQAIRDTGATLSAFAVGPYSTITTMTPIDPNVRQLLDVEEFVDILSGKDAAYQLEPDLAGITVYLDTNNNGQLDLDPNGDGVFDDSEPWQVTGEQNTDSLVERAFVGYRFENLPLSDTENYVIRAIRPEAYGQTATNPDDDPTTSDPWIVQVKDGEPVERWFGLHDGEANRPNGDPSFVTTAPDVVLAGGESFRYSANAVDPDADILTYDLALEPDGMAVDPDTGIVVWNPTKAQVEDYYAELREVQARLTAFGRPDAAPTSVKFDVLLIAKDGNGGQALQTIEVELEAPNQAPIFTSTFPETVEPQLGKTLTYQAAAFDWDDADQENLTYSLIDSPSGVNLTADGTLTWTPSSLGEQEITIQVSDPQGATDIQTIRTTVIEAVTNRPPELQSTPPTSIRLGANYFHVLKATDPDGDALTYQFVQENGNDVAPAGMTIDSEGNIFWQPDASQIDEHRVKVAISDGTDILEYEWTIDAFNFAENRPPRITSIPEQQTNIERRYRYDATASDPDGDTLLWRLIEAPRGMVIDPLTGAVSWQPQSDQIGDHIIIIETIDPSGVASGQEFTLSVSGANKPPTIYSTPPTQGSTNKDYRYTVVAQDIEGDALTYQFSEAPTGMTIDPLTGDVLWTPNTAGSYTAEVVVTDAQGGSTSQRFTVEVSTPETNPQVANSPHSITSLPSYVADTTVPYTYALEIDDPEGKTNGEFNYQILNWDALVAQGFDATSLYIDSQGVLNWTFDGTNANQQYDIVVAAADDEHGAVQGFTVTVLENQAPILNSQAPDTAAVGQEYVYDLKAIDPEGQELTYTIADIPGHQAALDAGVTIDELGRIRWTPDADDVGSLPAFTVTITDPLGGETTETINLTVIQDDVAPQVVIRPVGVISDALDPANDFEKDVSQGNTMMFQVRGIDDVKLKSLQLETQLNNGDWVAVPLDSRGVAIVPVGQPGETLELRATATDTADNESSKTLQIGFFNSQSNAEVTIDLNLDNLKAEAGDTALVSTPTPIYGTVLNSEGDTVSYKLEAIPRDGSEPITIFEQTNVPEIDGSKPDAQPLGTFDPSLLPNDSYMLRLTASETTGGSTGFFEEQVEVIGELKLGNFQVSFTDLELPVAGIPISVTRTYDSMTAHQSDNFGQGWRLEFRDTNLQVSVRSQTPEEELVGRYPAFTENTRVFVTLPGGKRTSFRFQPVLNEEFAEAGLTTFASLTPYSPAFVAEDGSGLTLSVKGTVILEDQNNGEYRAVDGTPYNPADFRFGGQYTLTTRDGIEYQIDPESGDLLTATDTNGNKLTFTDAGISSDTGVTVRFERDAEGRIVKVIDPRDNVITYDYDAEGNLIKVTDAENNETEFFYEDPNRDHFLTRIEDPLDRPAVRTEYLPDGKLKKIFDADGDPIEFEYDPDSNTQITKDALGNPTLHEYDDIGNVIRQENAAGHTVIFKYEDPNDPHLLTQTIDANGNVVNYTYDAERNLTSRTELHDPSNSDPATTYYTYNEYGQQTSVTLPTGATFEMGYNSQGNLTALKDGDGNVIQSWIYLPNGNLIQETDQYGTTYYGDFDAFGNPGWMQDANGDVTEMEYNANGDLERMIENPGTPEEEVSLFTYDSLGREDYVDYGDGLYVDYDYEGAGGDWTYLESPTIGTIERKFTDDGKLGGWVTPEGENLTFTYHDNGQLWQEITPDGTTTYLYNDPLGRVTEVTDENTGIKTLTYYDEHQTTLGDGYTDPDALNDNLLGQVAAREIRLPDGTSYITHYTYYTDGQIKTMTDANGELWRYEYTDTTTTVIDPLGRRTTSTQTAEYLPDSTQYADGTSTSAEYLYDNNLLEGSDYPTEITDRGGRDRDFTYDEFGRLESATDWGDTVYTFHYDGADYDYSVQTPTGETILGYNYTDNGEIETIVYGDGGNSRSFVYDPVTNELMRETLPSGAVVDYTYDPDTGLETRRTETDNGNVVSDVTFGYDPDTNQLTTVTENAGTTETTTYLYEPDTGAFAGLEYPDGSKVEYGYDALGRMSSVKVTAEPDGVNPPETFETTYEYDGNNNLTKVVDPLTGTTTMTYDEVNRLTERTLPNGIKTVYTYKENTDYIESITHYAPEPNSTTELASVTYERAPGGEPTKITREDGSYVELDYDPSLRLESEAYYDDQGVLIEEITYTYDADGNRQSVSSGVAEGTYDYGDSIHQLSTIVTDSGTETYRYDDGGRVDQIVRDGETFNLIYNSDDLLVNVTDANGVSIVSYDYDSEGRRVEMSDERGTRDYLVAPNPGDGLASPHLISDAAGDPLAAYVYAGSMPLMRLDELGNPVYYLEDGMGSVIGLAD